MFSQTKAISSQIFVFFCVADDIFHGQWIINLHPSHMWSLNTEASHTQCSSKWHCLLFALLPRRCRVAVINEHFSLEGAEWKEKNKRKAPRSRQRVPKAPEQTPVLSRHHGKVPRAEHRGGVEFSNEPPHTFPVAPGYSSHVIYAQIQI